MALRARLSTRWLNRFTGMPAHPMPADLVFPQAGFERLPQVNIRQLSTLALPAPPPPIRQPLGDAPA